MDDHSLILKYKTRAQINKIVGKIGAQPMKKLSHGFAKYGPIPILEAAKKQAAEFTGTNKNKNAAVSLMGVVLSAARNYKTQVEPHLEKLRTRYSDLTLQKLKRMCSQRNYMQFKEVWGHADEKKFETLKSLLEAILALRRDGLDDMKLMRNWACSAHLERRKTDSLGSLKNVGIATFQHLRIVFGADTVKPDRRVREVLEKEFGAKLSAAKAIQAAEEIAQLTGLKVIEIDQVFVKYGSGYYAKSINN